jgi:thymidylate synthase (FAD)
MKITPMQVELLDHMGSDLTVVNTARVSFAKTHTEFNHENDVKLINYLAKHNHWTPFGHCFAQFRIKAPIFVARQMVKHQIGLVWNEESRRYIDSEPEFWFPEVWRGRPEGSIKQGSSGGIQHDLYATDIAYRSVKLALATYNELLTIGVAPEQARMVLPLNTHTEWIWSGSLAAWARVCKLRLDPHAQKETMEVAKIIDGYMSGLFPVSWEALLN